MSVFGMMRVASPSSDSGDTIYEFGNDNEYNAAGLDRFYNRKAEAAFFGASLAQQPDFLRNMLSDFTQWHMDNSTEAQRWHEDPEEIKLNEIFDKMHIIEGILSRPT